MLRTTVATNGCALFGTRVKRLRAKCVRQPLPGRTGEDGGDGVLQPLMRVQDDELHPCEATRDE